MNGLAYEEDYLYLSRSDGAIQRSSLTLTNVEILIQGLTQPRDLTVYKGHLYVSGSLRHYQLDPIRLWSVYETVDSYAMTVFGSELYLANQTQGQLETLSLPQKRILRLDQMTSVGTENSPFVLRGEGLEQVSAILFDGYKIKNLYLVSPHQLIGTIPQGEGSPRIILLDQDNVHIPHRLTFTYENPQLYTSIPNQAFEKDTIYLYGVFLDQILRIYLGTQPAAFVYRPHEIQLTVPEISNPNQSILFIDKQLNVIRTTATFGYLKLTASICFVSGTLVHTDQGAIEIQNLHPGHTIYGKEIQGISETYYNEQELVKIEPHAFSTIPTRQTRVSKHHKLLFQGKMREAQSLVGLPGVTWVPYQGEKLYNVLLQEEGRMNVQGMICETLDPSNPLAHVFRWNTHLR